MDFLGSKRVEKAEWSALVGVIANGGEPMANGSVTDNELLLLGSKFTYTPKRSGYLYCFANDAWHFYDNNRGSVTLTVARK